MAAKTRVGDRKIYTIDIKEADFSLFIYLYFTINDNSILTKWYKGSILGLVNKRA